MAGWPASLLALDAGHVGIVTDLLDRGASPLLRVAATGELLQHRAACRKSREVLEALSARGELLPQDVDAGGHTVLHLAVLAGADTGQLYMLLDAGCDPAVTETRRGQGHGHGQALGSRLLTRQRPLR